MTDLRIGSYKKYEVGFWAPEIIRNILTNETYIGTWHFGKTKMIEDGKARKHKPKCGFGKQVARPKEEWISVPVPPIIDRETYDLAQARMKLNIQQSDRNRKHGYLLSKRLKCAKCGKTYQGRTRKNHIYYYCKSTERRPVKRCDMPIFRGKDVENAVWNWLTEIVKHPESIIASLQDRQQEQGRNHQALSDRLNLIEGQIAKNEKQLGKLLDLYLSGDFEREMLVERRARLEGNLENLRREYTETTSYFEQLVITDNQVEDIKLFCESIRCLLDDATFEQRRQLLEKLDVRGTLAVEENEKVVYIKCLVTPQQRLSLAPTSHLSSTGETAITLCVSP